MIIAIADSMMKNRMMLSLSDPKIFFIETSLALFKDNAVLIFTKLKAAMSNISSPIPENINICLILPFSPSSYLGSAME